MKLLKAIQKRLRTKTQSEIILIAYDLNKSANFLKSQIGINL